MKLKDLFGQLHIDKLKMEAWYDFEENCLKIRLQKDDMFMQKRYGVIINIDPEDIPVIKESMVFPELYAVDKDKVEVLECVKIHTCPCKVKND